MITEEVFDDRVAKLYATMQRRFAGKKWKSGKRQGTVRIPKQDIPFTRHDLGLRLYRTVGYQAIPCPGCARPIDILNLTLDHVTPVARGGSLGLDNLQPLCSRCNSIKGKMTHAEFCLFRDFLAQPAMAFARTDLEARVLSGNQRFLGKPTQPVAPIAPRTAYRSPQRAMDYEVF